MSSSNWRDGEIRELLTNMGEKVTQSHLTKTFVMERSTRKTQRNVPSCQAVTETASVTGAIADSYVLCTETFYNAIKRPSRYPQII